MMYGYHHGAVGLFGWVGMIIMLVFWAAVIVLIIWAVSALISSPRRNPLSMNEPREDSAMRILRERYARGEIDTDQFEQARQTLEGHGPSPA